MWSLSITKIILLWMASLVPPQTVSWSSSYSDTASAIAEACSNDLRCAAILTAIGYHESRFDPDAVGDNGQSVGLFQISRAWRPGETVEEQAVTAVRIVRDSFRICHAKPMEERLGFYASGKGVCGRPKTSRIRMHLAKQLLGGT